MDLRGRKSNNKILLVFLAVNKNKASLKIAKIMN